MEARSNIVVDREYFEKCYADWIKYRAKWRPYELPFSIALICVGVAFAYFNISNISLGFGVVAICGGLYHAYQAVVYRSRWIKDRLDGLPPEKTIKIAFHDTTMDTLTPSSQGTLEYSALSKIVSTPNGLFLLPQTGVSIYVPRATVEPQDAFLPLCDHLDRIVNQRQNDARITTDDVTNG